MRISGKDETEDNINFSIATYSRVSLDTPAGSPQRGIVDPGPQYDLPVEIGPLRAPGTFGSKQVERAPLAPGKSAWRMESMDRLRLRVAVAVRVPLPIQRDRLNVG